MAGQPRNDEIRILIADSQAVIRSGVRLALEEQADLSVAAEACDAAAAFQALHAARPDVAVVELGLPGGEPHETVRRLAAWPALGLVLLSGSDDPEVLAAALSHGARAILAKNAPMANLVDAIRAVRQDRDWVPPHLEARLDGARGVQGPSGNGDWAALTPRERDVADLVAQGLPYREVAARLDISDHTVKNHLRRIYAKLDINSRVELAVHVSKP
jgi:DNA-binding NarL/FixJ family response regulator